jgi:hypothetical protein
MGSPSEDAGGVIAAPTFRSANGHLGVYLLNAKNGAVIKEILTGKAEVFPQPVFAENDLLIAGADHTITAYEAPATP